ncbi:hypothetical protein KI387_017389 [Taxus chinensis]|uniref:CCHC-type domain-containing protein n=1 Tax=Taxus chinensis TaxID=29808 RepID=A0AA38GIS8_TAXCH|nr:hypothetical protein KI387_017389 [Taxus chinensis]
MVMVDSSRLALAAPPASLSPHALRRCHPFRSFVALLQDQNNKPNIIGVCKENFKLALSQSAQKPAFVQPKEGLSRKIPLFKGRVPVDIQESCNDSMLFMFGMAQQRLRCEKIIQFLTSGCNRRLDENIDISLLSELMGNQCLPIKSHEWSFYSYNCLGLYGYGNSAPDESRQDMVKFRDCFQTYQKPCGYSLIYTRCKEPIPQFLQSDATVTGWVDQETRALLFPITRTREQGSVANIRELHLANDHIKPDQQFSIVPHFENSFLETSSIEYGKKSLENLYGTTKFEVQTAPLSGTTQKMKSSVSSPAKLKPKHRARKKNKKLVKQKRDIFEKSRFQHYEYMLSVLLNRDSATLSVIQLKKSNQKELTVLLNQISVGLAGSGLGITLFAASKMLAVNACFDRRKLMNIMFGIGLLWLSAGVQNLREVVLSITEISDKFKLKERKIVSQMKRELTGVFFKTFTLIAFSMLSSWAVTSEDENPQEAWCKENENSLLHSYFALGIQMASAGLRDQDKLDGASNFGVRKARISLLLEENGIKEYVTTVVSVPTDATQLLAYKKEDAKARRLILDGVKDHIVPHIAELDTAKTMWDAIMNLYQNATTNRKLILKEKLRNTRMNKGEDVTSYLTRLRLVKDELAAVGDKPSDDELEELRLSLVNGANNKSQKSEVEQENVALAGKGKAKKGSSKGSNSQGEKKKKDSSKIKCYGCHEFGHYVSDCPERKKNEKKGKKQVAASASADELSSRMEDEFALIA